MPAYRFQGRLLDVRPDRIDIRDREYQPELRSLPDVYPEPWIVDHYLPQYSDLVLDQGTDGSCTGYGLACLVNYLHWTWAWRETLRFGSYEIDELPVPNEIDPVSPHMLYGIARVYDEWPGEDYEGSSCRGAMKGWNRHGVCREELWPRRATARRGRNASPQTGWEEDAARRPLGAYYRIDTQSIADLQSAIFEVGAIYASAMVHAGWELSPCDDLAEALIPRQLELEGGHAFALVGYCSQGLIVQNSWGPDWGFYGFGILSYEDWIENGMDAWVAVLGAPSSERMPTTLVRIHQRGYEPARRVRRGTAGSAGYVYQNEEVRPWSQQYANLHTIVLGNNGLPLNRLVGITDAGDAVRRVAFENIDRWLSENAEHRHVVIYGHGGLASEEDAIQRVQVMGPYFMANGIHPLFVNWKTGILETFQYLTVDTVFGVERARRLRPMSVIDDVRDWFNDVGEQAREAADRTIEVSAERVVKPFWTQMKQNASSAAWRGRGLNLLCDALVDLKAKHSELEIHMVGHSAGSLLLGNLLPLLPEDVGIATCTLWAPACTIDFALQRLAPAIDEGKIRATADTFAIEILDDVREREDSAGPYGKSILYLVSRALEDFHKTPLLGLERVWGNVREAQPWARETVDSVREWTRFCRRKRIRPVVIDVPEVSNGAAAIPTTHGNFDNDAAALTRCLARMLQTQPKFPVENLSGY